MKQIITENQNGDKNSKYNGSKLNDKHNPFENLARERDYFDSKVKDRVENLLSIVNPGEKINLDQYNWKHLTVKEQRQLIDTLMLKAFPNLTPNLANIVTASFYYGDCARGPHEKPDWLDMEKFERGQRVGREHLFGINFSQLLSLFTLFSFDHALKPLIFTDKSSTPYTSFKRYHATAVRCRNWYTENPWEPGTLAYKDIQTTRKMHSLVRIRLDKLTIQEIESLTKIKSPMCPTKEVILDDMRDTVPSLEFRQCPHALMKNNPDMDLKGLSQAEMTSALFGFFGLFLIYPEAFGAHNVSEEDFDAFCHTWKGLSYLLGIDDDFSFCRGSLDEIRQRMRDFLHIWVKPNFQHITPEWEHMMRCVVEGINYFFPCSTYEVCLLYLTELMDIPMPRLYKSLSYIDWIQYKVIRFLLRYMLRIPGMPKLMTKLLNIRSEAASNFTPEQHAKLQEMSNETLKKLAKMY